MRQATGVLLTAWVGLLLAGPASADGWAFKLEPYAMASSIEGDASIGRATGVDVDVDMSDILEALDIGAMIHFEAQHESGWGVLLDYGFMDLRDDISGPRGGVAEAKVRQGVFEALVGRRSSKGGGEIEYFGGVRWWDNDIEVDVDLALLPGTREANVDQDWVDVVLGVRWSKTINDDWGLLLRGDVGGFGLESDFTSTLQLGLAYTINDRIDIDFQYRSTWVDFEDGTRGQPGYFEYDTVTHGPIVGLVFKF